MAINKVSETTKKRIRDKSVLALPDKPSEKGYSAQQLKEYFTNLVLGDESALTEIDRMADEINKLVGDISDTTIKNYVLDSIVSKLIEQSPYIGLFIVDNKLKYTKFGSPNITGELDYIPEDSVFFNGEYLISKSKENILPKTSIDKLIDTIDDKTVREYILYLNSRINELLEKHNSEISSINSNIEGILGGDAPDALNSIKELAEALKNNPSQVDNILLQLSNLNSGKVDKVNGKQLSTNDYDNVSKSFVDSLKSKNLVEVENLKTDLKQFNDDSEHRLVTDDEKATWNSKANSIHLHEINDVNGLQDALNSKSSSDHTHTLEFLGAESSGTANSLVTQHNTDVNAHEYIQNLIENVGKRIDGINSALSFENFNQLTDWFNGTYTRHDGKLPSDLYVGQYIYLKDQDEDDYWVSVVPATISNLSVLPTDKIDLNDYAEKDDLKRVAFTGSYIDLTDKPTIPTNLSDLKSDESHNTITNEKLQQIDTNKSNIESKLDKNLGASEANKMLITDSSGNISTAQAGSMSMLVDNLDSYSTTMAPTANQVRVLNNKKLDKQQGTNNAGKELYVDNNGMISLKTAKTKLSEFTNDQNFATESFVNEKISAIPTPDVSAQISAHNSNTESHSDIRQKISELESKSPDVSGFITKDVNDLTNYKNNTQLTSLLNEKQASLTDAQLQAVNSGATSANIGQISTNTQAITTINNKIPAQASSTNQLADKEFVNSTVSTATATFRGTFNTLAELQAVTADENDYGFVKSTDSAGNTVYKRYKYSNKTWMFEYDLNNSSFTAEQWASINSGITATEVEKINNLSAEDISCVDNSGMDLGFTNTQEAIDFASGGLFEVAGMVEQNIQTMEAMQGAINDLGNTVSDLQISVSQSVPTSRTINNKPLSTNITLSANDVGALSSSARYVSSVNGSSGAVTDVAKMAHIGPIDNNLLLIGIDPDNAMTTNDIQHANQIYIKDLALKSEVPEFSDIATVGKFTYLRGTDWKGVLADKNNKLRATSFKDDGYNPYYGDDILARSSDLLSKVYPIGSVYMSVNDKSPASFLGGTWEKLPSGYALWTATSGAGGTINAGLPNITGRFRFTVTGRSFMNVENTEGAFSGLEPQGCIVSTDGGTSYNNTLINFNANDGATVKSIYGNSTTVQPPAYKVYAWKRIS